MTISEDKHSHRQELVDIRKNYEVQTKSEVKISSLVLKNLPS